MFGNTSAKTISHIAVCTTKALTAWGVSVARWGGKRQRLQQFIRWPRYEMLWKKAFRDIWERYHDTLITNPIELCALLTKLNVTNDPALEEARRQVELTMMGTDIESIKEDASSRSELKSKVDAILGKFEW